MEIAEIVYLCTIVAVVFGLTGWWCGCSAADNKCNHQFEEVLKTISHGKSVVVHMCKKCGKRKITKV